MGCYYSVAVEIPIHEDKLKVQEVVDAIKTLNDSQMGTTILNGAEACVFENDVLKVEYEHYMSHGRTEEVDRALKAIGEHATGAAVVEYALDGEDSIFAIGPDQTHIDKALAVRYLDRMAGNANVILQTMPQVLPREGKSIQELLDKIDTIRIEIKGK